MPTARVQFGVCVTAGALCLALVIHLRGEGATPPASRLSVSALAPVVTVASGFDALAGIAVESDGAIVVIDRERGTLGRIDSTGRRRVLLDNLRNPTGVAVDTTGGVLVLDMGGRRLLRRTNDGQMVIVSSTLNRASAIAVGPDGRIWLAARRATDRNNNGVARDDDDDDRALGPDDEAERSPATEYVIGHVNEAGALVADASGFMRVRGLAADNGAVYVALMRLATERGRSRTTLVRLPVRPDGSAGPAEPLLHDIPRQPTSVAVDSTGALFISGQADGSDGHGNATGVIVKHQPGDRIVTFASWLSSPAGLAFAPNGDLIAIEREDRHRVIRFRAPAPPTLPVPAFANRTPLMLPGHTVERARITLSRTDQLHATLTTAQADARGTFIVTVPLTPNATSDLALIATGSAGEGLVSQAFAMRIVHDNIPPVLVMLAPATGLHAAAFVPVRARADDERSGVAALSWSVDGAGGERIDNLTPASPLIATSTLSTTVLTEGPHDLAVSAIDRAGNRAMATTAFLVDRAAPETLIVSGPADTIAERTATFTVSGTDAWSAATRLDFTWHLDGAPWSPFEPRTAIELRALTPGTHRFEARARDEAGNEDVTPAVRIFTVQSLSVRIVEPAAGATVTTRSVWVRGRVEGGTGAVTVNIVMPAGFAGTLGGPVEGGMFALEVPADAAFTPLTIRAMDASGVTAQASTPVMFVGGSDLEQSLAFWPPGGSAPLTVRIGLEGLRDTEVSIDLDGDGLIDFEGQPAEEERVVTYDQPGIYLPTVRFVGDDGAVVTRRGLVEVYDRPALDAQLQATWSAFTAAIRTGDVDLAVSFIAAERRQAWTDYLRALPADRLADVDRLFTSITLVDVGAGGAQYEMVAERDGLLYSYAVWFQVDSDGRWRLWQF